VRVATWNVNSINQRLDSAVTWLAERKPDIVCFQETKCVDDAFPREPFEALGYNVAVHGQKTFNGVALLSKFPFDEVSNGLPGDDGDDHARFLEAVVSTANREIHLQARLDETAFRLCARAPAPGRTARHGGRLQRDPERGGCPQPARLGERCIIPAAHAR
jgi:hypothetical protein